MNNYYCDSQPIDLDEVNRRMKDELDSNYDELGRTKPPPFPFIHSKELIIKPITWLVHEILPLNEIGFIFGKTGVYKSFIALDLMLCVAAGITYHGHRTKQKAVFYICGEGFDGIAKRVIAWGIENDTDTTKIPFYISRVPACLTSKENVITVFDAIKSFAEKDNQEVGLIVIDTLARNLGGNKSESTDIGSMYQYLIEHLRVPFECCITIVAHVGHGDESRISGSYDIEANAGFVYSVKRDGGQQTNSCVFQCKKMKDDDPFYIAKFDANQIDVGVTDEDGNNITSLALSLSDKPIIKTDKALKANKSKGNYQRDLLLDVVRQVINSSATHTVNQKQQRECLDRNKRMDLGLSYIDDGGTPTNSTKAVTRASIRSLAEKEKGFSPARKQSEDETKQAYLKKTNANWTRNFDRKLTELVLSGQLFTTVINDEELFWLSFNVKPINTGLNE